MVRPIQSIATLDELATILDRVTALADLFPQDLKADYRRLAALCHPDRYSPGREQAQAHQLFIRLREWYDRADSATKIGLIRSPQREYSVQEWLGCGDLADVYLASAEDRQFVLKVCRPSGGEALLVHEFRTLELLAKRADKLSYRHYLPEPVESFVADREGAAARINVFRYQPGFQGLESLRQRAGALEARHLAWLFKRLLEIIGLAHECGTVHGGVLPPHLLVHAEGHSLLLVDWTQSVAMGRPLSVVPTRYRAWYPPEVLNREPATAATDIYLAAKCLPYAAGGDPLAERWSAAVPGAMRAFVKTCLYPSPRMRPQNAWRLHEEFDELLVRLFGSPHYHPLKMV